MLLCNHQQQAIIFLLFRSILSECFRYTFSIKRKTDFTSILLTFGKLPASHRCVFYTGPHLLLKRSDSQTRGLTVCQISLKLYKALLITPFHICMKVILISPCKFKIFLLTYHSVYITWDLHYSFLFLENTAYKWK